MASRFDPSAFIDAEEKQALAAPASVFSPPATERKPAENRHFSQSEPAALATIATIAAPLAETPWSAALTLFVAQPCPADVPPEHWDELVNEAEKVERTWGEIALGLGWSVHDLYGCPPEPLAPRFGQSGLVHAIVTLKTPVRLASVDAAGAKLQPFQGPALTFYRSLRPGAVLLWEAYRTASGP